MHHGRRAVTRRLDAQRGRLPALRRKDAVPGEEVWQVRNALGQGRWVASEQAGRQADLGWVVRAWWVVRGGVEVRLVVAHHLVGAKGGHRLQAGGGVTTTSDASQPRSVSTPEPWRAARRC